MARDLSQEELEIRIRNRHRMIGAAVLTLGLVVVVPQFLEHAVFPKSVKSSTGLIVEKGVPSVPAPAPVPEPQPQPVAPAAAPVTVTEIPSTSPIATGEGKANPVPSPAQPATVPAASAADKLMPAARGVLLQVGVFHTETKAHALSQKLNEQGFHSRVEKQNEAGKPIYRVLLGPMSSRAEAAEVKARLEKIQISVMVKPQK
jgi:cell division protein FtsN